MKIQFAPPAVALVLALLAGHAGAEAGTQHVADAPASVASPARAVAAQMRGRAGETRGDAPSSHWLSPANACLALAVIGALAVVCRRRGFD